MPAASDILQFVYGQLFEEPKLPKASFSGKTIVITGANTGLGFESAKQIVGLGASTVILGCRSLEKGAKAKAAILASCRTSADMRVWHIDMNSFESVQKFSDRLRTELSAVHAVIANAAISVNQYADAEGFESTLTVNVLSTFFLAQLVLPQLKSTAARTKQATHLTIVGSNIHTVADNTQLERPQTGKILSTLSEKDKADMASRYFLSKLIVMQCVRELAAAETRSESLVIINSPSPGWCKTELFRSDDGGFWGRNLLKLIGRTAEMGARCLTSAIAAGPESHGQYLSECRVKPASVYVRSAGAQSLQRDIWNEVQDILKMSSSGDRRSVAAKTDP